MTSFSLDNRAPPTYCCIPIEEDSLRNHGDEIEIDFCGNVNVRNSNMVLRSGPHKFHAIASRDMKAGTVIVQCLPTAYSITELNTEELIKDASLRKIFNGSGIPKRCTYCLFQEGEMNGTREGKSGGICSKCSMVHYCSRSCQVCSISICITRHCCTFSFSI